MLKDCLADMRRRLVPLYGRRETEAMIRLIFYVLKRWRPVDIVLHEDRETTPYLRSRLEEITDRLERGEPVQYVMGETTFYGMDLRVRQGALIPRPETEELVRMALERLGDTPDLHVLDACTGSGAIALALARNLRYAHVTAFDLSDKAIVVAEENVRSLKTDVFLTKADALELKKGELPGEPWDAIVSNPPYVAQSEAKDMERNVLQHEPHMALFVPDDNPLRFYDAISRYGLYTLKEKGMLFYEINPLYATPLLKLLGTLGYSDVETHLDVHGRKRFVTAILRHD